jgi:hypothetical protein
MAAGGVAAGGGITTLGLSEGAMTSEMAVSAGLVGASGRLVNVLTKMEEFFAKANPKNLRDAMGVIKRAVEANQLEPGVAVVNTASHIVLRNVGNVITEVLSSGQITVYKDTGAVLLRLIPK